MAANYELGRNYEVQIRDHIINVLGKPAYLWEHAPETLLISSGIIGSHNEHRLRRKESKGNPLRDTGIDIIQVDSENKCSLIQCKNGYKGGVTMKDLSGFMCWVAMLDKLDGFVYYTDKLSENIKCLPANKRITFIREPYKMEDQIKNEGKKGFPVDEEKLVYQNEAKELAVEHFKGNSRGILSMPCGTGKTYTSYLISRTYKQVILLSPLKQFAKQNLDRYIEYGYDGMHLLVDSDGERDLDQVVNFIASNGSFLISATYDSVDVIVKSLDYMSNPLFIIDEFHNLSKGNITNRNDDMNKLLNTDHKILFMSATPRVYDLEDDENDYDSIFGKTIYKMQFSEAIKNGYITDYKIWLPSIHEDNGKLERELDTYQIDGSIKGKCTFLFSCLLNCGSRKCIVYCTDTQEIDKMIEAISKLNEYYYLDYNTNQITSRDPAQERARILNEFTKSSKIELLFSVRILDECIDIPLCDSIFITYPSQSKIRTIQRVCRCIRIDKRNKFKVGNVFIWCDQYDSLLETLSGIKEYDCEFRDKVKVNASNYFGERKAYDFEGDAILVSKYTIGIKEFNSVKWKGRLDRVKEYIRENNKGPSTHSKDQDIKNLAVWISNQQGNYKTRSGIMKDDEIYNMWAEFTAEYGILKRCMDGADGEKLNHLNSKNELRCEKCNKEFRDKFNYDRHLKSAGHIKRDNGESTIKIYKCDKKYCDFQTKHFKSLSKHMKLHSGEKSYYYQCIACNIFLRDQEKVDKHIRTKECRDNVIIKFPEATEGGHKNDNGEWFIKPNRFLRSKMGVYIKRLKGNKPKTQPKKEEVEVKPAE
jgi:superfamily II DNA or RNA helicase